MAHSTSSQFRHALPVQIILPTLLTLILFLASSLFLFLPVIREGFMSRKREMLRNIVGMATSIIEHAKQEIQSGNTTLEEAQAQTIELLKACRYGEANKDYLFILNTDGIMIMHPYVTEVVNSPIGSIETASMRRTKQVSELVLEKRNGFITYPWQWKDNPDIVAFKLSYVQLDPEWQWIVGTGMYINDIEEELAVLRRHVLVGTAAITILIGGLCAFVILQGIRLDRKQRQKERETSDTLLMLHSLIDNSPSLVSIMDTKHTEVMSNKAYADLRAKVLQMSTSSSSSHTESNHPLSVTQQLHIHTDEVMQTGAAMRFEQNIMLDNTQHTYLANTFPIRDLEEAITGVCVLATDISDYIALQQQLKGFNENLEGMVTQRTKELGQSNEALRVSITQLQETQTKLVEQEKMAALGGLVAGVAHEINTPVGIAVTAASHLQEQSEHFRIRYEEGTLSRKDFESFVTMASEACNMILGNLRRASEHIQSFKHIAVDQTSEDQRSFNLKDYLDELLLSLRPQIKHTPHSITLDCADDITLVSYPGAFSQILTNLIMNSLTHGFEHIPQGQITVHAHAHEATDTLHLIYSDNGCGVPETSLARIFEPFFTTKRGQGGSGLGMHIVYNLVTQKLGGSITCRSLLGKGIRIHLIIPLKPKQPEVSPQENS